MHDSLNLRCLIEALQTLTTAQQVELRERDKYHEHGGTSWGYFGYGYIRDTELAVVEFEKQFDEYIEQKLEEKLTHMVNENRFPEALRTGLETGLVDKLSRKSRGEF